MNIYRNYNEFNEGPSCVALGSFDGLHLGHQALINKLIDKTNGNNMTSLIYTFFEHPRKSLNKSEKLELLTQHSVRVELFEEFNVDVLFLDDFLSIKDLSPGDFVKKILIDVFNIKYAIVGYNYNFGYKGAGNVAMLKDLGKLHGFEVEVVEPVKIDDEIVSSTLIRQLILDGEDEVIRHYLGRNYKMEGQVVPGRQNGRQFGIRTANVVLDDDLIVPRRGVHLTTTIIDGQDYKSVTNIGHNPTFGNKGTTIETHILDFDGDIYGKEISIELLRWIREEKKFEIIEELKESIENDIAKRLEYKGKN